MSTGPITAEGCAIGRIQPNQPEGGSQASKILRDPKSTKAEKSVAASDLAQAGGKQKKNDPCGGRQHRRAFAVRSQP